MKFGEIAHDRALEWVNYGVQNFEYTCEQLGVEPVVIDAQNDMEKVLAGMEDLLSQDVDAVSVYSFSPDLDARVAQMARDAGIPIVFENAVPADSTISVSAPSAIAAAIPSLYGSVMFIPGCPIIYTNLEPGYLSPIILAAA